MKSITCSKCGSTLNESHSGPCPHCGAIGKTVHVVLSDAIEVSDSISGEQRREYYQKNKKVLVVVVAITVISPFLGLFVLGPLGVVVGLVLGGVSYYLGPMAATKIIVKEKF
ncbi:MAG: transposase [Candidatus Thiodiazotropha sp. (ex Lucinoma borealis)]|nr:transposase [Candidatus Thiodiazotropha sp. (ex Lucinoma borealis)]